MHDLKDLINYRANENVLQGKNILITGASDGIGRAAALSYAQHGATVILLGRNEEKLTAVYDEIESRGGPQPAMMPLDFTTAGDAAFRLLAEQIDEQIGSLHGLLHNAGMLGQIKPLAQTSSNDFEQLLKVNLSCNFSLTKALLPALQRAEQASLVFTSSGVGRQGRAYWGGYAVAKFGVEGLMQVWADELGEASNVRVNSLNPGATCTAMRRQAYPAEPPSDNPSPDDIMGAYLFLMSDDSLAVNGHALDAQKKK